MRSTFRAPCLSDLRKERDNGGRASEDWPGAATLGLIQESGDAVEIMGGSALLLPNFSVRTSIIRLSAHYPNTRQSQCVSCSSVHAERRGGGEAKPLLWQASVGRTRRGRASGAALAAPARVGLRSAGKLAEQFLAGRTASKWRNSGQRLVTMSMIRPDNAQSLFMALTGCAAIGQVLETRTRWGGRVSGPLLAMAAGVILSGTRVIPATSPVYDMVFSTIMPLGAALTLLETDVWSAFSEAGATLTAFMFGALGTILGTIVSFKFVGHALGPEGWKIASSLCASYVGGTINYAATAQVLGLNSAHLLAAGMAADNLAMALYFGVIMAIPDDSEKTSPTGHAYTDHSDRGSQQDQHEAQPTVESMAVSLATATAACAAGDALASSLPASFAGSGLALMGAVASVFNALAAHVFRTAGQTSIPIFAGSQSLGGAAMLLFFAVVGASTGLHEAVAGGWPLSIFIGILISIHLTTIFALGRWARLPVRSILVGSNANVGGPATAAAMANARCWPRLVRPALVVGTLGYVIGTGIGCLVGVHVLQPMGLA